MTCAITLGKSEKMIARLAKTQLRTRANNCAYCIKRALLKADSLIKFFAKSENHSHMESLALLLQQRVLLISEELQSLKALINDLPEPYKSEVKQDLMRLTAA